MGKYRQDVLYMPLIRGDKYKQQIIMIEILKKLFFKQKKNITLELSCHYPEEHLLAGEITYFGPEMSAGEVPKIHQLDTGSSLQYWLECAHRINTGKVYLRIIYRTYRYGTMEAARIAYFKYIGIQQVVFPAEGQETIQIEGKQYPLEIFAPNEGLTSQDFTSRYRHLAGREGVIIHFSDFRY